MTKSRDVNVLVVLLLLCFQAVTWAQAEEGSKFKAEDTREGVAAIPSLPQGSSTILGGAIADVDPILDRFTLNIPGEKPMRILFDERTQVYRDGEKIPLRNLGAARYASVQTTLDGASVFAISIRMLSHVSSGYYQGEIVSFNPSTNELGVISRSGGYPLKLRLSQKANVTREGQKQLNPGTVNAASLTPGSLVGVEFTPDGAGGGIASQVKILATQGDRFVIGGEIAGIDLSSNKMVLLDTRDMHSYDISFNATNASAIKDLRRGQRVRVVVKYDGAGYNALNIEPY